MKFYTLFYTNIFVKSLHFLHFHQSLAHIVQFHSKGNHAALVGKERLCVAMGFDLFGGEFYTAVLCEFQLNDVDVLSAWRTSSLGNPRW